MTADPDDLKACCAAEYSGDLVGMLLGDSYHPGGLTLTRHLLTTLEVQPGHRLVDIASGTGRSALLAATEYGVEVDGVDLSPAHVSLASGAAAAQGLDGLVRFHHGDAEAVPLTSGEYDAVICECALCTFPDKGAAAAEMARVLRPGGRVGITDVTADRDRLPAALTGLGARIACVADARTTLEYEALLLAAGLRVTVVEEHPEALERMILQIAARAELLRMTDRARAERAGLDFSRVPEVLHAARDALGDGTLGYARLVAENPA